MGDDFAQMVSSIQVRQQSILDKEENLRITLNAIGDGVLVTDTQGRVVRLNPVAESLIGWTQADAIGQPLKAVYQIQNVDEPEKDFISIQQRLDNAVMESNELLLCRRGGEVKWVSQTITPVHNHASERVGTVIVFRDITETRRLEEQLQQARKMESIGQLAGGIAHDFNNMLGAILGSADLLTLEIPPASKALEMVQTILSASQRASALVKQLLVFSRKERATLTELDLHECIRSSVKLLERSLDKRIQIECHLLATHSRIRGNDSQLENMLLNLGINARDAMPNGGVLRLCTDERTIPAGSGLLEVFSLSADAYLVVEISDTGVGMDQDLQKHIFEPFFTTKKIGEGTGLGLASVYGTVLTHRGAIGMESEPGKGTTFFIYLPLVQSSELSAAPTQAPPVVAGSGCILLVDDEEILRRTAQKILSALGYDVLEAKDGAEAIAIYREHWKNIHVVLLDVVMPNVNGRDALIAIREINPEARVLIVSGFSSPDMLAEIEQIRIDGFLSKPYTVSSLSTALAKILI
jgi:PAS domain S-box-containing protein